MELSLTIQPEFQKKETQIFAIYHIQQARSIIKHNRIALKCRHQEIMQIFINQSKIPSRAIICYNPTCNKSDDEEYQSVFQMQNSLYTEDKIRKEQGDIIIDLSELGNTDLTKIINSISFLVRVKGSPTLQYRDSNTIKSVYDQKSYLQTLMINPYNSDASNYIPVPVQALNDQMIINTQFMVPEATFCLAGGQQISNIQFTNFYGRLFDYFMQVGEYVRVGHIIFSPFLRLFNFELINKIVEETQSFIQSQILSENTEIFEKIKNISIVVNNNVLETSYKKQFMIIPHLQLQSYTDLDYKSIVGLTSRIIHELCICISLTCCQLTCDGDYYYALVLGHILKEFCYNRYFSQIDAFYLQFQTCQAYQQLLNIKVPARAGRTLAGRGTFTVESELRAAITALYLFKNRSQEDLCGLLMQCFTTSASVTLQLHQCVSSFESAETDGQLKGNGTTTQKYDEFQTNKRQRQSQKSEENKYQYQSQQTSIYNGDQQMYYGSNDSDDLEQLNSNTDVGNSQNTLSDFKIVEYIAQAKNGVLFELEENAEGGNKSQFLCSRELEQKERDLITSIVKADKISGIKPNISNCSSQTTQFGNTYGNFSQQKGTGVTRSIGGLLQLEDQRNVQERPDMKLKFPFILFSKKHSETEDLLATTSWLLTSPEKDELIAKGGVGTTIQSIIRSKNQESLSLLAELLVQEALYVIYQTALFKPAEMVKFFQIELPKYLSDENEQQQIQGPSRASATSQRMNRPEVTKSWKHERLSFIISILNGQETNLKEYKEELLIDAAFYVALAPLKAPARSFGLQLQKLAKSHFFSDKLFLAGIQAEVWSLFCHPSDDLKYVENYRETLQKLLNISKENLTSQNIKLSVLCFIGALIDYALAYYVPGGVDDFAQLDVLTNELGLKWQKDENNGFQKQNNVTNQQNLLQKPPTHPGLAPGDPGGLKVTKKNVYTSETYENALKMQTQLRGAFLQLFLARWREAEASRRDFEPLKWSEKLYIWAAKSHQLQFDDEAKIVAFLDLHYIYQITLPVPLQEWSPSYLRMVATQIVDVMVRNFHPGFQQYCLKYGHAFAWSCFAYCGGSNQRYNVESEGFKSKFNITNIQTQEAIKQLIQLFKNTSDITLQASICGILGAIDRGNLHSNQFLKQKALKTLDKQLARIRSKYDENPDKTLLDKRVYQGVNGIIAFLDDKQIYPTLYNDEGNENEQKNVIDCLFSYGIAALI